MARYVKRYRKRGPARKAYKKRYRATKKGLRRAVRGMRKTITQNMIHVKIELPSIYSSPRPAPPGDYSVGYALNFGACPEFTNYKSFFQFYRVNKVVYKFEALANTIQGNAADWGQPGGMGVQATYSDPGRIWVAKDYISSTSSTLDEIKRYNNVKCYKAWKSFSVVYTPACSAPFYETPTNWGFKPIFKQWIRTVDNTVPFYGLKTVIEAGDTGDNQVTLFPVWRIQTIAYVSFRNPLPSVLDAINPGGPDPVVEAKAATETVDTSESK